MVRSPRRDDRHGPHRFRHSHNLLRLAGEIGAGMQHVAMIFRREGGIALERALEGGAGIGRAAVAIVLGAGAAGGIGERGADREGERHRAADVERAEAELEREAADRVQSLLAKPLSADGVVQVAMLNSRELQALYADLGLARADVVQAGLFRNPILDAAVLFPLSGARPELQLGAVVNFLDALYIPLRKRVAAARFEEAKLRVTGTVLDFALQARTAFYAHQANEQLLELECDVLVPAAREDQITARNAGKIRAKVICEGANGPTSAKADPILQDRGILVIPDILANAGGVTVSYFEWVQDRVGYFWSEERVSTIGHSRAAFFRVRGQTTRCVPGSTRSRRARGRSACIASCSGSIRNQRCASCHATGSVWCVRWRSITRPAVP